MKKILATVAASLVLLAGLTACDPQPPPVDKPLNLPLDPVQVDPTYWSQFPDARAAGWDRPGFFPIGGFWTYFAGEGSPVEQQRQEVAYIKDLGLNYLTHGNSDQDACVLAEHGISWLGAPGSIRNLDTCGSRNWPGNFLEDEVDGTSPDTATAYARLTQQRDRARAQTPGKFIGVNYTTRYLQIYAQASDGERFVNDFADMVSSDDYVFSSPNRCVGNPWWVFIADPPPSQADCRDAQSYGKLTDGLHMRDTGEKQPLAAMTEVFGGADPSPTSIPLGSPAKVKASAISNVIHGAGFLLWFPLSFRDGCRTDRLMSIHVPDCAKAHQDAAAEANKFVQWLAPVINSTAYEWDFGPGLDTRLWSHEGKAWVLAMTDGGTGERTFTLPPDLADAEVVGTYDGRRIPVEDGKFTDTYETDTEHQLYVVNIP